MIDQTTVCQDEHSALSRIIAAFKAVDAKGRDQLLSVALRIYVDAQVRGVATEVPAGFLLDLPGVEMPPDRVDYALLLVTALASLNDAEMAGVMNNLRELIGLQIVQEPQDQQRLTMLPGGDA